MTTLSQLHAQTEKELQGALGGHVRGPTELQPSPELIELLVWNVLVSYVVNVAAAETFPMIKAAFRRWGLLGRAQLKEVSAELNTAVIRIPVAISPEGTKAAASILEQNGFSKEFAEDMARRVADMVHRVAK